jgi:hypothetical protein
LPCNLRLIVEREDKGRTQVTIPCHFIALRPGS